MPRHSRKSPSREGFARELAARTERLPADDPERQVEALRQFQKVAVFAVALADLTGRLPLMSVSDRLTDIAELIVQCCMDLAWEQMTKIYGVPYCGDERSDCAHRARSRWPATANSAAWSSATAPISIWSFCTTRAAKFSRPRGERPLDNGVFFLRLGAAHRASAHDAFGGGAAVRSRHAPAAERQGRILDDRYRCVRALSASGRLDLGTSGAAACAGGGGRCGACVERFEAARRRVLCTAVRARHVARGRDGDALAHAPRVVAGRRRAVRHQTGCGRHRRHRIPGAILGAGGGAARIRNS